MIFFEIQQYHTHFMFILINGSHDGWKIAYDASFVDLFAADLWILHVFIV